MPPDPWVEQAWNAWPKPLNSATWITSGLGTTCSSRDTWMFTGIVSAVAKVVKADRSRIGIDHAWVARRLKIGGSVAVNGCCLTIVLPSALSRFVAVKGSIAVDGVSLTVAELDKPPGTFKVALIPHTLEMTIAGGYKRGSIVNLEADVVARYVARNLRR